MQNAPFIVFVVVHESANLIIFLTKSNLITFKFADFISIHELKIQLIHYQSLCKS